MYRFGLPLDSTFCKEKADLEKFGETLKRLEIEIIKIGGNNCQKHNQIEKELQKQVQFYYHDLYFVIKNSVLHEKLKVYNKKLDELIRVHRSRGDVGSNRKVNTTSEVNKSFVTKLTEPKSRRESKPKSILLLLS